MASTGTTGRFTGPSITVKGKILTEISDIWNSVGAPQYITIALAIYDTATPNPNRYTCATADVAEVDATTRIDNFISGIDASTLSISYSMSVSY